MVAPVTNYSVHMNARPALSGGAFTAGFAVCNPNNAGWVVADTTNLASGAVDIGGIALETAVSGGASVQVLTAGYCPPEVIGTISGTGGYVNVTSTGALTRSSTVGSATVGKYQSDGGVIVDLGLQDGGAVTGNATAIQGVTVSSASATRSWILAGDGTNLRSRKDVPNTRDYDMPEDGVTSARAGFVQFLADVGTYGYGKIHKPSTSFLIDGFPVEIHDDTASGLLRGIHLEGPLADPFAPTIANTFLSNVTCPSGSAASITAFGNGGSGQNMQTLTLGAASGVLAADADHYVGRPIRIRYADTKAHNGEFFVTSVPSDNTVTIYQPNFGAAGSDANSGSIRWKIYMPMLDIRAREFRIEGISFAPKTGAGKLGPLLEIGQPYRSGGTSVIQWAVERCAFASGSSTALARYGVQIAKQVVFRAGYPTYAANGAGVPHVSSTSQVDTGEFYRCAFFGMDEMGVCHSSPNAQSKEVTFVKCQFGPSSRNVAGYGAIGYGAPRNTFVAGGSYTSEGSPGPNFLNCSFGALDMAVQLGGGSSMPVCFDACYWESSRRILRSYSVAAPRTVQFFGCALAPTGTQPHPSRELMELLGDGPVNLFGTDMQVLDTSYYHIVFASGSTKEGKFGLYGSWLKGTTGWTGQRARLNARTCGPYVFDSGDTIVFAIDGGANQTVTITVANFATAGCVGTVDLNEVTSWQLGQLINYYVTGSAAWGDYDNAPPVVESATQGGASRVECVSMTGKAAYLDFPTGVQAGIAQSTLSAGTSGWFDNARTAGSVPVAITSHGVIAASFAGTHYAWWEGVRRFGTVPTISNNTTSLDGGTFTAITGGIVTVAGAVVTIADNRVTASSMITLIPTNAAAVALGAGYLSARTADASFAFTFPGAPATTETFIYTMSNPT